MGWTTGCANITGTCIGVTCTSGCSGKTTTCSSGSGSAKGGGGGTFKPASTACSTSCKYAGTCGVRGFSGSLSSKSKTC